MYQLRSSICFTVQVGSSSIKQHAFYHQANDQSDGHRRAQSAKQYSISADMISDVDSASRQQLAFHAITIARTRQALLSVPN